MSAIFFSGRANYPTLGVLPTSWIWMVLTALIHSISYSWIICKGFYYIVGVWDIKVSLSIPNDCDVRTGDGLKLGFTGAP